MLYYPRGSRAAVPGGDLEALRDTACCAIITEPARGIARDIHDRMPLVLADDSLEAWLDPELNEREAIRSAIHHLSADVLTTWPVSKRVNRAGEEESDLIERVPGQGS